MKLKSLILGSVAAAGLSTAGFAADLGVLTSLDVCDELGLSGLTISSDTNCLQISGGVEYEFNWGDYNNTYAVANTQTGARGGIAPGAVVVGAATYDNDWSSKVTAWLKFVGTASSDFGPAKAVIKLKTEDETKVVNEGWAATVAPAAPGFVYTAPTAGSTVVNIDEAYVQIGDATVIMAGKKGSIANFGDDEPFNWLGLFNSDGVDKGVMFAKDHPKTGGHVIQVVSDLGNGVNVGIGLENLNSVAAAAFGANPAPVAPLTGWYNATNAAQSAGTLVGVVSYAGDGITAHLTGLAGGVLDGVVEDWAAHAGITGTFDAFKVRLAGAYGANNMNDTYWNVLGSASATFDMFTIALSGEATGGSDGAGAVIPTSVGAGGSIGATVTEGVTINLGGKWFDSDTATVNTEGYQVAVQLVAAVTETIKITGEAGVYGKNFAPAPQTDFYGAVGLDWTPGGGFTSSLKGEAHQNGAYKVTFKAAKSFE